MKSTLPFEPSTVVRTVVLFVALLNQFLVNAGYSPLPFDDEGIEVAATTTLTIAASLWAWWYNNSLTYKARQADQLAARKGLK